jgi:hypothetical protein
MRQTLLVSALLIIAVGSACTRQGSTGVADVPDALTAMSAYRCDPIDMTNVSNDVDQCAAKTMAGQRAAR